MTRTSVGFVAMLFSMVVGQSTVVADLGGDHSRIVAVAPMGGGGGSVLAANHFSETGITTALKSVEAGPAPSDAWRPTLREAPAETIAMPEGMAPIAPVAAPVAVKIDADMLEDAVRSIAAPIDTTGSMGSRLAVTDKIQERYSGAISWCYLRALSDQPELEGALRVALSVDAGGQVIGADVSGLDADVSDCVQRQTRSWRFDNDVDVAVETTLLFRPGSRAR